MRRRRVLLISLAGAALLAWAGTVVVTPRIPERVWIYLPEPAWRDDPPAHVALAPSGERLSPETWVVVPVTQTRGPALAVAVRQPSATWRRIRAALGLPVRNLTFSPTGREERSADGGRWIECFHQ